MTIFRTEHKKNYTVVNNFISSDARLSWKAKGIWLYAFSRPDDWQFNIQNLIEQSTDGRESVQSGLKELENAGYLHRCQRRENGVFVKAEWVFYETPREIKKQNTETGNPFAAKPVAVKPPSGNQPLLSTEAKQSTESLNTEEQQQHVREEKPKKVSCSVVGVVILEDIFSFNRKNNRDWGEEEIKFAFSAFEKKKETVSDPIRYIERIINRRRTSHSTTEDNKNLAIKKLREYVYPPENLPVEAGDKLIFKNGSRNYYFELLYSAHGFWDQLMNAIQNVGAWKPKENLVLS